MRKNTIKILAVVFMLTVGIGHVYAEGYTGTTTEEPAPPSPSSTSSGSGSCNSETAGSTTSYGANYPVWKTTTSTVGINTYKYNQETHKYELVPDTVDSKNRLVAGTYKAGTFVGIDYFEEYKVNITVGIEPYCIKNTITVKCSRDKKTTKESYPCPCAEEQSYGEGKIEKSKTNGVQRLTSVIEPLPGDCTCTRTVTTQEAGYQEISSGTCSDLGKGWYRSGNNCDSESCLALPASTYSSNAISILENLVNGVKAKDASYKAKATNYNNINKEEVDFKEYRTSKVEPEKSKWYSGNTAKATVTLDIKYNPQKACINIKTADIRYISFTSKCNDDEMPLDESINENGKIGPYFIPLNAKTSNAAISYKLEPLRIQDADMCEAIIEEYSKPGDYRWRRLLVDLEKKAMTNLSKEQALEIVKNGCYYRAEIFFNVNQEFYNEEANKIRGYGSYFRSINIYNPFPNGLASNSYWGDFYNEEDKQVVNLKNAANQSLDITKSYEAKTYSVYLSNGTIKSIRDFNNNEELSQKSYTSWISMYKNGISSFIDNYGVNRYADIKSFYKLGCGPANKDWRECKK